jgi:hypothetical protein
MAHISRLDSRESARAFPAGPDLPLRAGGRYRAMALYYSMLMFAQAARGALVPAQLVPDTSG